MYSDEIIQMVLKSKGVDLNQCRFTFKNWQCPTNEEEFLNNIEWVDYEPDLTWQDVVDHDNLLVSQEPLRLLRIERDRLLKETDWMAVADRTMTQAQIDYRQALRDLPANSTPSLDENGQLTGVTWPTPPE